MVTGAKTEEIAKQAARTYGKIIHKLDYPVKFKARNHGGMLRACA